MRTKVTLVLLFLNVALFFFIFYVNPRFEIKKEVGNRVLGAETANIQTLEIKSGDTTYHLKRSGDSWLLTQPFEWPANDHAVRRIVTELQLLEQLTSFTVEDLARNGQSLADYGLEPPNLTVVFTSTPPGERPDSATATTTTLRIGRETPVDNRLYVLSPDGQRVHVVRRSLAESLALTPAQWRADTLLTIPGYEARALNIKTDVSPVRLRRDGSRWLFESPIQTRGSKAATELTISSLNGLRATRFLQGRDADPERTGLTSPAVRVSLEGNKRSETLLIGNAVPVPAGAPASPDREYYARLDDRPAVFTVVLPGKLVETLRNAQKDLRERRILDFDPAAVTAITLIAPGQPALNLQRLEGVSAGEASWQIVRRSADQGPQTVRADRTLVERLLQRLMLLEAEEFYNDVPTNADLENLGFTLPERRITLAFAPTATGTQPAATPPPLTLELGLGGASTNHLYAKLAHQNYVYVVPAETLNVNPVAARVYRDRLLQELPTGARIVGLSLVDVGSGTPVYTRQLQGDETWEKVFTSESSEKRAAVEVLLAQLRTLRAKSFVRESFTKTVQVSGEERPWKYQLDATIALVGGAGTQATTSTLFFAERGGGGTQLVGSPEFGVVFEAEQPLLDALWALTYGPRDPGPGTPPAAAPTELPAPKAQP